MATITILKSELDEMDRLIHDQKRIIQDQQALLTRVLEILKPNPGLGDPETVD